MEAVVCMDPETKLPFLYNLENQQIIQKSQSYESIEREVEILKTLRGFDLSNWNFVSAQSDKYRRRQLHNYILQNDAYPYPALTTSRELSSAFADTTQVKIKVRLDGYIDFAQIDSEAIQMQQQEGYSFNKEERIAEFKAGLVTSADEVVKNFIRLVYRKEGLKIQPLDDQNKLVFKVTGKRDYLVGNYPMLAYICTRQALRGLSCLNVTLTEVPKRWNPLFPLYININEKLPSQLDPILFWYPHDEKVNPLPKPRIYLINQYDSEKIFQQELESINQGIAETPQTFSGYLQHPLQLNICGLERVSKIFSEGLWGKATDNGLEDPNYIVTPNASKDKKDGKHKKSVNRQSQKLQIPLTQSNGSTNRKNSVSVTKSISLTNSSPFSNHGNDNQILLDLQQKFNLPFVPFLIAIEAMLLYGEKELKNQTKWLKHIPFSFYPRVFQPIVFDIPISEIPLETRVGFNIYAVSKAGEQFLMGSSSKCLFDEFGALLQGLVKFNIWPFYKIEPSLACMQEFYGSTENFDEERRRSLSPEDSKRVEMDEYCQIIVQFPDYLADKVIFSQKNYQKTYQKYNRLKDHEMNRLHQDMDFLDKRPKIEDLASLERDLSRDPLYKLTKEEKQRIFICRNYIKTMDYALILFLKSVNWLSPLQVQEAHKMLKKWHSLSPEDALALLNPDMPDEQVRIYAVKRIAQMADDDIVLFMPQLTQHIRFECNHYSPLGELLIERALRNPYVIGHALYWSLRSQMHIKASCERIGLLLEQFLMLCGSFRKELYLQHIIASKFKQFAKDVKKLNETELLTFLRESIEENQDIFQQPFMVPIDCTFQATYLIPEKCRVMSSKKLPLWLTLNNSEENCQRIPVMFKLDDDLRQDIITLQMIRVMDNIWLENGLDLRMSPYTVTPTGDQQGFIELVTPSETTSDIQKKGYGAFGALRKDPLKAYLEFNNPGELFEQSMENFIRSCAGYCVATYILGIGDRHNGNILMKPSGHLFHIDFGHFLGKFKSKFGIKRERAPFVFTEEMAYVMGGKNSPGFEIFNEYSCRAYNLVRKYGRRLINLFLSMVQAGMPELKEKYEITYLKTMLSLRYTEMEADKKFRGEILKSLGSTFRRIDNLIHNLKH